MKVAKRWIQIGVAGGLSLAAVAGSLVLFLGGTSTKATVAVQASDVYLAYYSTRQSCDDRSPFVGWYRYGQSTGKWRLDEYDAAAKDLIATQLVNGFDKRVTDVPAHDEQQYVLGESIDEHLPPTDFLKAVYSQSWRDVVHLTYRRLPSPGSVMDRATRIYESTTTANLPAQCRGVVGVAGTGPVLIQETFQLDLASGVPLQYTQTVADTGYELVHTEVTEMTFTEPMESFW